MVDTWDNLYSFFLGRVRDKLHIILCFSPVGTKFARRAQQFPGLINGCTIDWFLPWPEEALQAVSGKFIDEFSMACPPKARSIPSHFSMRFFRLLSCLKTAHCFLILWSLRVLYSSRVVLHCTALLCNTLRVVPNQLFLLNLIAFFTFFFVFW